VAGSIRDRILAEAERKNAGAISSDLGTDFQHFVAVVEILRLAASTPVDEVAATWIAENVRGSEVDDIHIVQGHRRRHIQVKSDPDVHWITKLRREFKHDRILFREQREHLVLELCVRNEALASKLDANRYRHRLGFVKVSAVDIDWLLSFPSEETLDLVRPLVLSSESDEYLEDMWYQVKGVWDVRLRRSGTLNAIFSRARLATGFAMRAVGTNESCIEVADALNEAGDEGLLYSADGERLRLIGQEISMSVSLDEGGSDLKEVILGSPPESVIQFMAAAAMFKEGDELDDR
jgi:hypothetical protein